MLSDQNKGFEIAYNLGGKILRVRLWGDWNTDIDEKYRLALQGKLNEIRRHWTIWYVLVDVTQLSSPVLDLQRSIETQLRATDRPPIKKIAYIRAAGALQLPLHCARDDPIHACFQSTDDAVHWLHAA